MIFDTHAHYDDKAFDEDRESLLLSLPESGIGAVVNVGADLESSQRTVELIQTYPFFYGAAGIHPSETGELGDADIQSLEELVKEERMVAVGEIGLDYYWKEPEHHIQKKWFVCQLDLARRVHLPVIIHSRDAAKDTLDIVRAERGGEIGGVVHCFSYSKEIAREYLNLGFFLGVGGVLTFQNARQLREVVEYAPMDRLVLETDCPYLSPVPYRGKRNSSLMLPLVVQEAAKIKGISPEEVSEITWNNAKTLYRIFI